MTHFGGQRHSDLPERDHRTGHLSGCCLIAPVPALRRIGGPDPRYFFRGEEWDLNHRLAEAATDLVISDSARVYHDAGTSHNRFEPRMLYFAYRAKVLFARTHQPGPWFVLWYVFAFVYAATIAPIKFQRLAGKGPAPQAVIRTQKALVSAFVHGLTRERIQATDF